MTHQHFVGEHPVLLVQPVHIGCPWGLDNDIFRSSVWDLDGNLVSASFKKFFNWDEKPDLDPAPASLQGATLMEKVDGSTLIFSRYKGHTVIRTRGTVDARKQENGHEIDLLCEKYGKFIAYLNSFETSNESFVLEWTSPNHRIVLNYGDEPDMILTAIIDHSDYSYMKQSQLDYFASELNLRRPRTFKYDSVEEMKASVEAFKGMEGLCVYYNGGQHIRKVKGAEYLAKHRMKSELSNIEKVMDLWLVSGRLPYQEFFNYCETAFDYEIANDARGFISNICDAWKEVVTIEVAMKEKVALLADGSRKDAAAIILQVYGNTNRASFAFKLLDGKPLDDECYKKLLYQCLK